MAEHRMLYSCTHVATVGFKGLRIYSLAELDTKYRLKQIQYFYK